MINSVSVFRYISILGHHKQNLVVSGIVENDGEMISLLTFLFTHFSLLKYPSLVLSVCQA